MTHFRESTFYEEALETPEGVLWWTARISCSAKELLLQEFTLYPTTSTRLVLGFESMRAVFRHIEERATDEGFSEIRLEALRLKPGKRERMLSIVRRLK